MKTGKEKIIRTSVACLFTLALSACGESDLVDIHERQLDDALTSQSVPDEKGEPDVSPALPDNQTLPADIDMAQYELTFSDEFNGDSLDALKWNTSLWSSDTVIYDQLQHYVDSLSTDEPNPSPFSFNGEYLTISATMTSDEQRASANEQPYLSGLITTRDRFVMRYGYVETRVNVKQGTGIWPSFWMLGSNTDGLMPELYVFEYDGAKADSVFHNYNYLDADGNLRSPGQQEVLISGISDGFHTFGMRWNPSELLFYVDGQPTYRIIGENVPSEDMYLILNLAMGGVWPGAPDATTPEPATLEVDYVRVYQMRDN